MIMQFTGNAPVAAGSEPGMLQVLSQLTADVTGGVYPFFSGFIGAFGAFIAGSNTVSDILFGLFQFEAAQQIGAPTRIVVAAQAVGGAISNLVAIHNVVTTLTVVGLVGEEGRVIRLEPIPNGSAQRFFTCSRMRFGLCIAKENRRVRSAPARCRRLLANRSRPNVSASP